MAELEHQEEVAAVIRRATEIEEQTRHIAASDDEIAQFVRAAEEMGLSRDATLQALRERLHYSADAYDEGKLVFAKSGDGRYYPAKLLKKGSNEADVRFSTGGEASVSLSALRPFSITPGVKLEYNSPTFMTWTTGDVVRVNPDTGSVTVTCYYVEETMPLERIRLPLEKPESAKHRAELWAVGLTSGLSGAVLGALALWLLRR